MNGTTDFLEAYINNGGGTSLGGNSTNIQYKSSGGFAGSDSFARVNGSNTVSVTGTISATNTSVTMLQPGPGSTCGTGTVGALRKNPSTGRLQVCLDH